MSKPSERPGRAPVALRLGLPFGGVVAFLGLVIAAAFTGTADWGLAIPIGLVIGGIPLLAAWLVLRSRGVTVLAWIDDYWSRDE